MKNPSSTAHRVLILDADLPSSYTILRSLSKQGITCDIASSVSNPICSFSRYTKQSYRYPDPLKQSPAFIDWICELLQNQQYSLVIPVTERSLIPLSSSDKLDQWRPILAIADKNSLDLVLDKSKTLALAKELDINIPFSQHISTLDEVQAIAQTLEFPVALKPVQSISSAELRHQLTVTYAHSADELIGLSKALLSHCPILIQEYAQGIGTGIEILANRGEIVFAFQHERVHELPLTGGGSCLRKSIAVDETLLRASQRLISALNWHGVAMVEFKWQRETNKYWLMEINGRFWGSLPLAYAAGADFPYMLFDLLVNRRSPNSQTYRKEVYCRKLSADIQWYEQVLRRSDDSPLVKYPHNKQLLTDSLLLLNPTRHFFDLQCWHDPIPGLVDIFRLIMQYGTRVSEILHLKALSVLHKSRWMKNRLYRKQQSAKSILFLCYGNINRSALAQVLAKKYLSDAGTVFDSAGFHPVSGRPADPNMVRIAEEYNVDLSACSSKTITESLLKQADIIFVMEIQQYIALKKSYADYMNKVFLLGSLTDNIDLNIPDPYNKPLESYRKCFLTIKNAIEKLHPVIE